MIQSERYNNGVAVITLDRPAARNALTFLRKFRRMVLPSIKNG